MTTKATFAAGCFWGVEQSFKKVKGVKRTTVGYTGGSTRNPTYDEVCTGRTGHAEAVQVEYDPSETSYGDLLEVFWNIHDPTTRDRQGPDMGSQYRSAIFCHSQEQMYAAIASRDIAQAERRHNGREIVTEIVPAEIFHPAEEYHQNYLEKRGVRTCMSC